MASSAQSVATSLVFDYLYKAGDASATTPKALVNAEIRCTLTYDRATSTSPVTSLAPVTLTTTTDSNGYWSFNLVPNSSISPANTTYTIQTPYSVYQITVGTSGPYQSTAVGTLVTTPTPLAPATTNLTGPLSITNLTAGDVVWADTGGALSTDNNLTFNKSTKVLSSSGIAALGLTGATQASRYVGATTYGAPTTGTFVTGDYVISQASGSIFVCTSGGTPGTWAPFASMFNIKDYGAKLDGATDDTTALNNAITAANSASGVVLVPPSATACLISGAVSNANNVPLLVMGGTLFSGAGAPTSNIVRLGIVPGRALYVATTGSDNNPGTQASPFATLQKAVNVAKDMVGLGVGVTINVASGSYVGFVYNSNGLSFNGAGSNAFPAGITINGGFGGGTTTITVNGVACIEAIGYGANVVLQGTITFTSTGYALFSDMGALIQVNSTGITFGTCTNAHIHADRNSNIIIGAGYTISGSAPSHLHTTLRGFIGYNEVNMTVTLSGSPVFSQGFAFIFAHGTCYIPSGNITFSGAAGATTPRFVVKDNSLVMTNGGSATYLPGTSAGQCLNNGRYQPMPQPVISGLGAGWGTGATATLRGGSNDFEGVVEITTGTTPGSTGTLTLTPGTAAPSQISGVYALGPGSGTFSTRATVSNGQVLIQTSVVIQVDNNGVNFTAGQTYDIHYKLTAA